MFPEPYPCFLDVLAGSSYIGSSQDHGRRYGLRGPIAPKHYLKQFLPKYAGQEKVDQLAKDAGLDNWVKLLHSSRPTGGSTPSCRCSAPWKTTTPINTPNWVLERNPYYYAVDTEGNQLPVHRQDPV